MPRAPGQDILLDTAAGTPVPNSQASKIQLPLAAAAIESGVRPPSTVRSPAHPRFNCHGLTFAARRTAIHDDAHVQQILSDDGYVAIDKVDVLPGDVVLYVSSNGTIDHSGLVVSKPAPPLWMPLVVSKWGVIGPEVLHSAGDCGYATGDLRYVRVKV